MSRYYLQNPCEEDWCGHQAMNFYGGLRHENVVYGRKERSQKHGYNDVYQEMKQGLIDLKDSLERFAEAYQRQQEKRKQEKEMASEKLEQPEVIEIQVKDDIIVDVIVEKEEEDKEVFTGDSPHVEVDIGESIDDVNLAVVKTLKVKEEKGKVVDSVESVRALKVNAERLWEFIFQRGFMEFGTSHDPSMGHYLQLILFGFCILIFDPGGDA